MLDLLCDDSNHVIMPRGRLDINIGPIFEFKQVGRNKATTFTGLCDHHDGQMFEKIDKNIFKSGDKEYLFLLAYRSILREYHTKLKAGQDIYSIYIQGVDLGRFDPDSNDQSQIVAMVAVAEAYMFYRYKYKFDQIFFTHEYNQIEHKIDFIENTEPSIAVSSVYSNIDNIQLSMNREDPKCIILNIFPQDNGLYIIFSFKKEHSGLLLPQIQRILEAERHYKLYLVSKLVLMHCENFVMAPDFYNTLSEARIESMKNFFMKNMTPQKEDCENENLFLFY